MAVDLHGDDRSAEALLALSLNCLGLDSLECHFNHGRLILGRYCLRSRRCRLSSVALLVLSPTATWARCVAADLHHAPNAELKDRVFESQIVVPEPVEAGRSSMLEPGLLQQPYYRPAHRSQTHQW